MDTHTDIVVIFIDLFITGQQRITAL